MHGDNSASIVICVHQIRSGITELYTVAIELTDCPVSHKERRLDPQVSLPCRAKYDSLRIRCGCTYVYI